MKGVWLLLSTVMMVAVAALDLNQQLERDVIIEAVNNARTTWTAGRNFDPSLKKAYIKNLMGVIKPKNWKPRHLQQSDVSDVAGLPKNFDSREKWTKCTSLQEIRDQGDCGSCWAVSSASAFTDRLCIATNATWNAHLSAQQLVSCCESCGSGCQGGWPGKAWQYFIDTGLVTGGDYHSREGCQPYLLQPCEHHGTKGKKKSCGSEYKATPACRKKCYNKNYTTPIAKDYHKVQSWYQFNTLAEVQTDIYSNGPVVTNFDVYEDFVSYKSGVYQHTTGEYLGGHAVKIIGWGVENNTKYWLVQNSWNSDWGNQGTFKIIRGKDDCGFEEDLTAGLPAV